MNIRLPRAGGAADDDLGCWAAVALGVDENAFFNGDGQGGTGQGPDVLVHCIQIDAVFSGLEQRPDVRGQMETHAKSMALRPFQAVMPS